MGLEKYKELYVLSNTILKEEHARFNRIDQKAVWYLSVVTVLIGVESTCGKDILTSCVPTTTLLQWLLLNLSILSFLMLVATWFVIFQALRIDQLKTQPLNQEMIEFFNNQTEVNIYYHIAQANSDAWEENRKVTDKKSKALFRGYRMIIATVFVFVAVAVLYFAKQWDCVKPPPEDQKMSQPPESKHGADKPAPINVPQTAPQEHPPETAPKAAITPDADVVAPRYVCLANERTTPE